MEPTEVPFVCAIETPCGLPPSPKVDLVLTLRNKGTKTLTFHRDILLSLHLTGEGTMNHPTYSYQTEGRGDEPKKVTLAPGKMYGILIQSLDRGYGEQSYWLLQGEYMLHTGCHVWVTPSPDDKDKSSDKSGFVHIDVPPLRVKVVAEKK
jgi:hypothetical protein